MKGKTPVQNLRKNESNILTNFIFLFQEKNSRNRVQDVWTVEYHSVSQEKYYCCPVSYTHLDVYKRQVLGLSKIARICDMVGKRLQLQERIGSDIAEIIMEVSGSEDVAVYIEGCHSCMSAREMCIRDRGCNS